MEDMQATMQGYTDKLSVILERLIEPPTAVNERAEMTDGGAVSTAIAEFTRSIEEYSGVDQVRVAIALSNPFVARVFLGLQGAERARHVVEHLDKQQ